MTLAPLLHAWQLWALSSELLLAVTHIKVLLCIGKPIGEQQLSDKRCSYFVYDLFSPWLSVASLLATPRRRRRLARQLLAAATAAAALSTGPATSSTGGGATPPAATAAACCLLQGGANDSTDGAAAGGPLLLLLQGQLCNATAAGSSSSCPAVAPALQAPASDAAGTAAPTAPPPVPPAAVAASMQLPQGGDGQQPLLPLALPPLLLLLAGHAALHVFYILTWHRPAARNVLRLSAVGSMRARFSPGQAWRRWEAVWFLAGTSADVVTHLVLAGLLLGELLLPTAA